MWFLEKEDPNNLEFHPEVIKKKCIHKTRRSILLPNMPQSYHRLLKPCIYPLKK